MQCSSLVEREARVVEASRPRGEFGAHTMCVRGSRAVCGCVAGFVPTTRWKAERRAVRRDARRRDSPAVAVCEGGRDSRRRNTANVRLLKPRQAGADTLAGCHRRPSVPCSGCVLRTRCLTFLSAERDARVVEASRCCGEFGARTMHVRGSSTLRAWWRLGPRVSVWPRERPFASLTRRKQESRG